MLNLRHSPLKLVGIRDLKMVLGDLGSLTKNECMEKELPTLPFFL